MKDSPAKPAPAPAKPATDRAWITAQLQDLISKRTGYPKDMLGLDIDLEADLGIDSIKRVEILAEMAQALGATEESGMPAGLEMEKLTAIGTLRHHRLPRQWPQPEGVGPRQAGRQRPQARPGRPTARPRRSSGRWWRSSIAR
ncbi:MAG: phosphopantetheine-binding protein [Gemmataceae bacterium]